MKPVKTKDRASNSGEFTMSEEDDELEDNSDDNDDSWEEDFDEDGEE